jgi:PAS domain S-box-containing protein
VTDRTAAANGEPDRVLVLAPAGRDAAVITEVLAAGDAAVAVCGSIDELCRGIEETAGAAIVAGEALDPPALERLASCLGNQPPWSDLPLLLLIGDGGEAEARWRALSTSDALGNVVLLERPMRREALLSAVQVALRARRRQYDIRDHLLERAQLAAIVDSSFDAVLSCDTNGVITTWNAAAERLYGYVAAEAIGRDVAMLAPPDRRGELVGVRQALERGEPVAPFATVRLAKGGRPRHVSISVSPLRRTDGALIGASVITRDISDLRRAQEHQKLLLAELSHRVKNTLAVVVSIANQTLSRSTSLSDFGQSFRGRIQALAAAHSLLTAVEWQAAELKALVEQALEPYRSRDGANIEIQGDRVLLQPNAALTLSLVLHELTTNAAKYGALQKSGGRVAVDWMVAAEGGQKLHLRWNESGGPPVRPPARRGFGINLIERSVAYELDGQATLDYRSEGLSCEIDVPLPCAGTGAGGGAPLRTH